MVDYKKQGKNNRINGAKHELAVRKDLEEKGWIVAKWMNQVEFGEIESESYVNKELQHKEIVGSLIPAKHKFCGFGRPMAIGTGFPDYLIYRKLTGEEIFKELKNEI